MSLHRMSSLLAGLLGSLVLAGSAGAAAADKVTICHFPPGNPGNFQTITIAPSALPAHLGHHDFGGPCENDCTLLGSICDDGNSCTVDTCNGDGTCAHASPTDCNDGNPCTADSCDPGTGACVTTPVSTSTTCDDGNACTGPLDRCDSSGECRGEPIAGCCTTNAACDDQNPCTDDTCDLGTHTCTNGTKTCTPSDLCHQASCAPDDGSCVEAPIECDTDEYCSADTGQCVTGCPCQALLPDGWQPDDSSGGGGAGVCPDGSTVNESSRYGTDTSTNIQLTVTETQNADCMGTVSHSCSVTGVTGIQSLPLTFEQYLICLDAVRGL